MSDADYPTQSDSRPASGGDPYQSPPSRGQMSLGGSVGYPYPPAGDAPTNPSLWAGDPSAPNDVPYASAPGMSHAQQCANSFSMINLMQQEPAGQYKVEFVTADGTTYLGVAIFDYFG